MRLKTKWFHQIMAEALTWFILGFRGSHTLISHCASYCFAPGELAPGLSFVVYYFIYILVLV
jgi:hypothetical protein